MTNKYIYLLGCLEFYELFFMLFSHNLTLFSICSYLSVILRTIAGLIQFCVFEKGAYQIFEKKR